MGYGPQGHTESDMTEACKLQQQQGMLYADGRAQVNKEIFIMPKRRELLEACP